MPTYEFECGKCQIVNDVWRRMSDISPVICSECNGKMTRAFYTAPDFLHLHKTHQLPDKYKKMGLDNVMDAALDYVDRNVIKRVTRVYKPDTYPSGRAAKASSGGAKTAKARPSKAKVK